MLTAAFCLLPLAYLVVRAFERGGAVAWRLIWRERTLDLALRSLGLAAAVTAACLVIGVLAAWLIVRTDLPGKRTWAVVLALPLAIPSYVAGFTWIAEWPSLAGFPGAFAVLTAVSFPYVLLPVAAALRGADPAQEEVARSLGRSPRQVFFSVTLRQVRPAATAGGLLVALYVLSDFGAVSLMRYEAFTLGIYSSYRASFDRTPAAVLGCVLVVLAVLLTWGELRARGRATARLGGGAARKATPMALRRGRYPAIAGVGAVAALSVGLPVVSLLHWLSVGSVGTTWWPEVGAATLTTLQVSALGAVITTLLALPVGVLAARHRGPLTHGLELASFAGHALPGITIGLALVFFGIRLVPDLYQRTPLLVIGYAVLFVPLAVGAIRTAVAAAPPVLEEVSRSLGHGRWRTFRSVTLPLAAPGAAAGAALVFLTCAKELPATLLLRPTGVDTLAIELWTRTGVAAYAEAAPYAAALVLLGVVPTVLLDRALHREAA